MGAAIISAISSGLGLIGTLATNINTALTNMVTDGASGLSVTGTFAFVLFGLGISVGVVKLVFNWLTGRHGM